MTTPRKKRPADSGFDPAALDALLGERRTMGEVDELFRQMKKALMERALAGELTHHLGYAPGDAKPADQPNHRNGTTPKTVLTEDGAIPLAIPRDRAGTFEPRLVPKHARRLPRFDQNVLSLYARGLSVREIRAHLEDLYQVEVAPSLISAVTDEVMEEVTAWQQRPLESCYAVVMFDCLRVKIRDEGVVRNKAVYVALGVTRTGRQGGFGPLDRADRGGALLAPGADRVTGPRGRRRPDRADRRAGGVSGGDHGGVPAGADPHLRGPPGAAEFGVRAAWQERKRVAAALRALYRADSLPAAEAALAAFAASADGAALPADRADLGAGLAVRGPRLRVSAGGPADPEHDERDRERAPPAAEDHQDAGALPDG